MKIDLHARNRAHQFEAGEQDKVLFAGLGAAIGLPYECGSGTCGTCKARLISGELHDPWPEAPGKRYLKNRDEFLMCQCEARSDLVLELPSFIHTMDAGACVPAPQLGEITAARALTSDVMLLDVKLGGVMVFEAGQYALVRVPGIPGYRGWSMVNFERRPDTLRFVVKRKPDGAVSDWLFGGASVQGTSIELFGPMGAATFHPSVGKNLLCIAGGSGIAGMMSILTRAVDEGYFGQHDGDLYFGVRTRKDVFFADELAALRERAGARLRITIALSDEQPAPDETPAVGLRFDHGFVHEAAKRGMQGRMTNVRAYIAGPPPAVDASIRFLLLEAKLTADNIRYDKFS